MEAFLYLIALVTIGYLVFMYRHMDRAEPPLHLWSAEYREARSGAGRGISATRREPVTLIEAPVRSLAAPEVTRSFPMLEVIDRAMGPSHVPFASDPAATALEQRARELVDLYWSERVWMTGLVDGRQLAAMESALEQERFTVVELDRAPADTIQQRAVG